MMTDTRDPVLLELFDNARQEFEGQDMTATVMVKTRKRLATMAAVAATVSLIVLLISWYLFSMPLLEFAVLVSQLLTNPLFDRQPSLIIKIRSDSGAAKGSLARSFPYTAS